MRILIPVWLVLLLLFAALLIYVQQPTCIAQPTCIRQSIGITGLLTAVSITLITLITIIPRQRELQHLTQIARRITTGDTQARILPNQRNEISAFILAFNNMTDHLHQTIAALQTENQQFSTLLFSLGDGVIITNEYGVVLLLNPAATRLLDPIHTAPLGRSFAEVVRHHQLIELWQKSRESRAEQMEAIEIGREQLWQVVITPFEEERNSGYLIILHDLTTIHKLQTVRRDFISNLSHELRTPLASLKAVIETLADGALDDPPAAQRFLQRGAIEVDVLTQMVEELLELSRIESGQVPFRFQTTAVANLLLTPLERMHAQAERKEIAFALDVQAHLPPVLADEERVQRVVTNLLHNAIKFTPEHGRITIRAFQHPKQTDYVTIAVADSGYGIAAADLPRIFERFYKSDRARTRNGGGTGLGLAISRHIVQAHHGQIWVESREGKGSTFYFTLPTDTQPPLNPAAP
jgi:two-component system phosphate regulon sensor histidine kinase PhoR